MFNISIVSLKGSGAKEIIEILTNKTGFEIVTDEDVFNELAKQVGSKKKKIINSFYKVPIFGNYNKLKDKILLTKFKLILGEKLAETGKIFHGVGTYFLPFEITSKFLLGGDIAFRIGHLARIEKIPIEKAEKEVRQFDKELMRFTRKYLSENPCNPALFNETINTRIMTSDELAEKILEITSNIFESKSLLVKEKIQDFIKSNIIQFHLLNQGEDVDVFVQGTKAKISINNAKFFTKKSMENHFEKIKNLLPKELSLTDIEVILGKSFEYPQPYRFSFNEPVKVLLVDDEIDFVDTLSERLQTRSFVTAVTYSGEEALENIDKDLPDVIVLDLKMPGLDGLEVLRRVKKSHPQTEVIILTGHGSEREKQLAFELGAFDYLEKPINIDKLSEIIKKAYSKIHQIKNLTE
ncbi:MAG: response regulator [Candidatus Kapaibacteriota bacterium]